MNISLVVAMDENNLIGYNNDLPWKLPNDLKFLKELTTGGTLVMGRKNHESFGRPLPNRRNIILTRNKDYASKGCEVFHTKDEIFEAIKNDGNIFIFGGSEIYSLFLPHVKTLYLTRIHHKFYGDTYFPEIDLENDWSLVTSKEGTLDTLNIWEHTFYTYTNNKFSKVISPDYIL